VGCDASMSRLLSVVAVALALVACASKPIVVLSKPSIKPIAVVPATTPAAYTLDNRIAAVGILIPYIGAAAYAAQNQAKANQLTERLAAARFSSGEDFTHRMRECVNLAIRCRFWKSGQSEG
jgi:hypothetical protein